MAATGDRNPSVLPDPRCDVAALRAFVAVARLGAVARAAPALGRTQPSISARLASLEAAWGVRLFRRVARGMVLTPEGTRLLPLAESSLRDLEELDRVAGAPVARASELRVGAGDALGRRRLPRAMAALLREYPGLEVTVREGPGPRLRDALRNGEIDLALVVRSSSPSPAEGLDLEAVLESDVEVLAPPGELAGGRRVLPLGLLAGHRLVTLQRGSGFRQHLESSFGRAGLPFRPAVEVGNLSLVGRFVAAGLGVAPVPAVAFGSRDLLPGVERRRIAGISPVSYDRAVRTGSPMSPPTRRLLELLRMA